MNHHCLVNFTVSDKLSKFRQLGRWWWYPQHKCSACWPWHNTERSRDHEQCVSSLNLTHETDTLRISDIKAWNSSANFHVRHSLIAVLTMWCYNSDSDAWQYSKKLQTCKHLLEQVILKSVSVWESVCLCDCDSKYESCWCVRQPWN